MSRIVPMRPRAGAKENTQNPARVKPEARSQKLKA